MTVTVPALVCAVALVACGGTSSEDPDLGPPAIARIQPVPEHVNPRLLRRFRRLRADPSRDEVLAAQVELGKTLFFEPRLSRDGVTSCNSCHPLDHGGPDQPTRSLGTGGAATARNAPTVWNAAFQVAFLWDGGAATLEEVAGPLLGQHEVGLRGEAEVSEILHGIAGYRPRFDQAVPCTVQQLPFAHRSGYGRYNSFKRRRFGRGCIQALACFPPSRSRACPAGNIRHSERLALARAVRASAVIVVGLGSGPRSSAQVHILSRPRSVGGQPLAARVWSGRSRRPPSSQVL